MKIKIKNPSVWQGRVEEAIAMIEGVRQINDTKYEQEWRNSFFGKIEQWFGATKPTRDFGEYPSMYGVFDMPVLEDMQRALNADCVEEIYFDENELDVLSRYVRLV